MKIKALNPPPKKDEDFKYDFNLWQDTVMIWLDVQEHRQICFVIDPKGNSGKTTWGKWMDSR